MIGPEVNPEIFQAILDTLSRHPELTVGEAIGRLEESATGRRKRTEPVRFGDGGQVNDAYDRKLITKGAARALLGIRSKRTRTRRPRSMRSG